MTREYRTLSDKKKETPPPREPAVMYCLNCGAKYSVTSDGSGFIIELIETPKKESLLGRLLRKWRA